LVVKNGSKMCGMAPASMPPPVSDTRSRTNRLPLSSKRPMRLEIGVDFDDVGSDGDRAAVRHRFARCRRDAAPPASTAADPRGSAAGGAQLTSSVVSSLSRASGPAADPR
jgi:hypothetical protein